MVPRAMVHALLDRKPKYRYRVGNDSKWLITPITWLHESTQDAILTREHTRPAGAARGSRKVALDRYDSGGGSVFYPLLVAIAMGFAAGRRSRL